MSVLLRPDFRKPAAGNLPSQLDSGGPGPSSPTSMASSEAASFPEPACIPLSGANASDIARAHDRLELVFDLALSAITAHIDRIRENVPVTHVESFFDLDEDFKNLKHAYLKRLRSMDRE